MSIDYEAVCVYGFEFEKGYIDDYIEFERRADEEFPLPDGFHLVFFNGGVMGKCEFMVGVLTKGKSLEELARMDFSPLWGWFDLVGVKPAQKCPQIIAKVVVL